MQRKEEQPHGSPPHHLLQRSPIYLTVPGAWRIQITPQTPQMHRLLLLRDSHVHVAELHCSPLRGWPDSVGAGHLVQTSALLNSLAEGETHPEQKAST